MRDKWILDVLADMRVFARSNSLPRLADALSDVSDLAVVELKETAQAAEYRSSELGAPSQS